MPILFIPERIQGGQLPFIAGDISEGDRGGVFHYVRWAPICRRKKAWYVLKHFYEGIGGYSMIEPEKWHRLKEKEIITEDEYNSKYKQLLGL